MTIAVTILAGSISGWAQSNGNTQSNAGRQGSSAVNNRASKATNSQLKGKGVPYGKEKEQFGKQVSKKKSGSLAGTGQAASDASQASKATGSHATQRERSGGHKSNAKAGSSSSKTTKQ